MTTAHRHAAYRDDIDALIGPIEEIVARADSLPASIRAYVLGGLEQAIDTLESARNDIDEYEPEPVEPEADDGIDYDDDVDTDEDEEA